MSLAAVAGLHPRPINAREESIMTATYTFDVFSSLDGFGSVSGGDWGGYWGKQGPELLDRRLALQRGSADGLRGQHLPAVRTDAGFEYRELRGQGSVGDPHGEPAGDHGVDDAEGTA